MVLGTVDFTDFWNAISVPLAALIVAMLVYMQRTIEGKISKAASNGRVQQATKETVGEALDESVHPRLDKVEVMAGQANQRSANLEQHLLGGVGQAGPLPPPPIGNSIANPTAVVPPPQAVSETHIVPGTQPENPEQ